MKKPMTKLEKACILYGEEMVQALTKKLSRLVALKMRRKFLNSRGTMYYPYPFTIRIKEGL